MIDAGEALALLEQAAARIEAELPRCGATPPVRSRSLVALALSACGLRVADLYTRGSKFPIKDHDVRLTLGAIIAFRAAERFTRAGATPGQAVAASYRSVNRYLQIMPIRLRDVADGLAPLARPPHSCTPDLRSSGGPRSAATRRDRCRTRQPDRPPN